MRKPSLLGLWLLQERQRLRVLLQERSSSVEIWNTVRIPGQNHGSPFMENH